MPPLPRLRVAALRDLADQLRYAPREALLRDLERIEALALTIDGDGLYPEDWVIERVTGYRPQIDSPTTLVGEAVMGDLSALVERLSSLARLREGEIGVPVSTIEQLCERWAISRKSLDRYRKRGLVARRVVDGDGRDRLVFTARVVAKFERSHDRRIGQARRYSRIDDQTRCGVLARASALRAQGRSLSESAQVIARDLGRSHEAIRQILKKHDERAQSPIFGERGPVSQRERELAFRGWVRGMGVASLARRLRRSTPSIRRAIHVRRGELLRSICPTRVGGAIGTLSDPLAQRWPDDAVIENLGDFLVFARTVGAPLGVEERARASARVALLGRAGEVVARIRPSTPSAGTIDEAETLLRWALRLKQSLVRSQLPTIVRAIEDRLGRPAQQVRASLLRGLIEGAILSAGHAVDEFDPSRGGRLAARTTLGVDRFCSQWVQRHAEAVSATRSGRRAVARLGSDAPMTDWRWLLAWDRRWLDLPPRARGNLAVVDPRVSAFLTRRFGLSEKPSLLDDLIESFELTRITVARFERAAIREALSQG